MAAGLNFKEIARHAASFQRSTGAPVRITLRHQLEKTKPVYCMMIGNRLAIAVDLMSPEAIVLANRDSQRCGARRYAGALQAGEQEQRSRISHRRMKKL